MRTILHFKYVCDCIRGYGLRRTGMGGSRALAAKFISFHIAVHGEQTFSGDGGEAHWRYTLKNIQSITIILYEIFCIHHSFPIIEFPFEFCYGQCERTDEIWLNRYLDHINQHTRTNESCEYKLKMNYYRKSIDSNNHYQNFERWIKSSEFNDFAD